MGRVPYRPIGQSHFVGSPWPVVGDQDYLPSDMSEEAMRLGLQKFREPIKYMTPSRQVKVRDFLINRLAPFWAGLPMATRVEVCRDLNWEKSPGWPYYYVCEDKFDAVMEYGDEIWSQVDAVLIGDETVMLFFNCTLKDELRLREKVAAHKTRVFCASGIVHLLVSKLLYSKQNYALMDSRGKHPLTVGVQLPGPEFVSTVLSLRENVHEADVGGSDARFLLDMAAVIREVRHHFLGEEFRPAGEIIYDWTYCGYAILEGLILQLWGMKSGCENTIWDTSLLYWGVFFDFFDTRWPHLDMMRNFERMVRLIVNGDDNLSATEIPGFHISQLADYFTSLGMVLEVKFDVPMSVFDVSYLSHHVRNRYVRGYGDILVAAGNKEKLMSSINFILTRPGMSFDDSCVTHLLGLRIALWPYKPEFETVNSVLDDFLEELRKTNRMTERIAHFLRARISEEHIVDIHTRLEAQQALTGLFDPILYGYWRECFPSCFSLSPLGQESGKLTSLLKKLQGMAEKPAQKKPTAAERAAQSARDKARAATLKKMNNPRPQKPVVRRPPARPTTPGKVFPQKNTSMVVGASGIAYEERFSMSEVPFIHPRHGRAVRLRGRELITMVKYPGDGSAPAAVPTGGVLVNWDVSPSNLPGSRAAALSALYEKFRFKVMQFEWSPELGSDSNGKVLLTYDPDCMDADPPASLVGLKQASSFAGAKDSTVWKPCAIRIVEKEDTLYFTNEVANSDPRFVFQGQFYLMNGGATTLGGSGNGDCVGTLSLAFELEFYKPAMEQIAASTDMQFNLPAATMRSNYSAPGKMFNAISDAAVTGLIQKNAGGIQRLVDNLGNTFFRVPPGNYRMNVSTTENGTPPSGSVPATVTAPTIDAKPVAGKVGAVMPTVSNLDLLGVNLPAGSINPGYGIQVSTSGDFSVNAPTGADIYGNMGGISNWTPGGGAGSFGYPTWAIEIDRIFGSQAISF